MNNVLITGVHKGLGQALARHYSASGAHVIGLSRNPPTSLTAGRGFTFHSVDLSDPEPLHTILRELLTTDTGYDLVILNAGILGELKRLADTSISGIGRVMDINVWANKVILDVLFSQPTPPRQVIAMSSGAAIYGSCGWGAYSISKAALNTLIRVYADEQPGCHFTALAPGLIETPMLKSIFDRPPNPDFPADKRLREARDQGLVQTPETAAKRISEIVTPLRGVPSGQYQDIRNLPFETPW